MSEAAWAAFRDIAVTSYAQDKVACGQWSSAEAPGLSAAEFEKLLPRGAATPGNHLYEIRDATDGRAVGDLWFAEQERGGRPIAYVYDVRIAPEHRRQGHAERAFAELERIAGDLGLSGVALHVFGHNTGARALYARLGFGESNVNLYKRIEREHG
jgi:ribosomal protein S18 acetylase RimI-like enzyme